MRKFESNLVNDQYRIPLPEKVSEVPGYLRRLAGSFTARILYIFRLVWETKRSLLFVMLLMAVFNGIVPVTGSLIGAAILNDLARVYAGEALAFGIIAVLLVLQFVYIFLNNGVSRIYNMITSLCGELVANHVRMKIMEKSKSIDMVSYDTPDFYARMENATREAGTRPIMIVNSMFSVLSTVISLAPILACGKARIVASSSMAATMITAVVMDSLPSEMN